MFSSRKSAAPVAAGGYNLTKSLRFRSSASAYLNRTPASAGNRKTWTWSSWVKRGQLGAQQALLNTFAGSHPTCNILFGSTDGLWLYNYNGSSYDFTLYTTAVYRDPSAWYHVVVAVDTTQATSTNRVKIYVNGVQITSFTTSPDSQSTSYPSLNFDTDMNAATAHEIGKQSTLYFDGYLAEVHFVDGQALTPSSFGETSAATGVWQPIQYTGTYGTNGFYLDFEDTSSVAALGYDAAGSNDWTVNNVSLTSGATYDSMKDVPTLTNTDTANYAVLNRLNQNSYITLTNGNLTATSSTNDVAFVASNIAMPGGDKYYFEITCQTSIGANFYQAVGIWGTDQFSSYGGSYSTYYSYNALDGTKYNNGTSTSYGATWTTGDVIGVAVDLVNGTLTFYKNGTSQGTAFTGLSTSISYYASIYCYTTQAAANFGQRPFAYTPPSGFKALNTFNLSTPTIGATASTQANKYFDINLYTGNGSTRSIVNSGAMSPDFVWIKSRSNALNSGLMDSVRGSSKLLISNATNAEQTLTDELTSFNSDGFSLGASVNGYTNYNTYTYVAWQWRASDSAAVTNTAGSVTSTVSANTTAGFSIVTWTMPSTAGITIGHGLGVAPAMYIVKSSATTSGWATYHKSLGAGAYLTMNTTAASISDANAWSNTAPTSSVFTIGTSFNGLAGGYVGYCFAEVAGYSAFGSYTGNGSTDGTFIYTGFRPKFVMIKLSSAATTSWAIYDSSRDTYNTEQNSLFADASAAEISNSSNGVDFLSNGFKLRTTNATWNFNGATYIYMAFAEFPFKFANGR